jgi:hypothetical protein
MATLGEHYVSSVIGSPCKHVSWLSNLRSASYENPPLLLFIPLNLENECYRKKKQTSSFCKNWGFNYKSGEYYILSWAHTKEQRDFGVHDVYVDFFTIVDVFHETKVAFL